MSRVGRPGDARTGGEQVPRAVDDSRAAGDQRQYVVAFGRGKAGQIDGVTRPAAGKQVTRETHRLSVAGQPQVGQIDAGYRFVER